MTRRLSPAELGATVRVLTIARAGLNKFDEVRLYFAEFGELYFQPNETGLATLTQFLGAPGPKWKGRKIVLTVQQARNPETGAMTPVVAVGVPRQWYDLLELQLPAL